MCVISCEKIGARCGECEWWVNELWHAVNLSIVTKKMNEGEGVQAQAQEQEHESESESPLRCRSLLLLLQSSTIVTVAKCPHVYSHNICSLPPPLFSASAAATVTVGWVFVTYTGRHCNGTVYCWRNMYTCFIFFTYYAYAAACMPTYCYCLCAYYVVRTSHLHTLTHAFGLLLTLRQLSQINNAPAAPATTLHSLYSLRSVCTTLKSKLRHRQIQIQIQWHLRYSSGTSNQKADTHIPRPGQIRRHTHRDQGLDQDAQLHIICFP